MAGDTFGGRMGLIFATIGAAIGTGISGDFQEWLVLMEEVPSLFHG